MGMKYHSFSKIVKIFFFNKKRMFFLFYFLPTIQVLIFLIHLLGYLSVPQKRDIGL